MTLDFAAILAAHRRILPHIHRTPVLTSARLNEAAGGRLFFKCENFQKTGAFKARGATNGMILTAGDAARGVATHSSGNHGAALARAAALRGIPAHIVMPANSARVKIHAVEGYGATVILCGPTERAREEACARILAETGATLIHPFKDERVMAGQGTAAVELLEEQPELDLLLLPVGGGGLLCGTAVAAGAMKPAVSVIAVEPAGAADTAASFRAGHVVPTVGQDTMADGLRATIGTLNFAIARPRVREVLTVSEESIVQAMRAIWTTLKIVVEPSAAVPYAAVLEGKIALNGRAAGLILTGGNVDLDALPWLKH